MEARIRVKASVLAVLVALGGGLFSRPAVAQETAPLFGVETSGFDSATADLVARAEGRIGELSGKPIVGVSIETTGRRWRDRPTLSRVKLGTPLQPDVARRALAELLDSGKFAQAYVDARPHENGVILRIVATPRRLIAQLRMDAPSVPEARLQAAMALTAGGEVTEPSLRDARSRVVALYRKFGFPRARVTLTTSDTDDVMQVLLRLTVVPGKRQSIARRIFVIEASHQAAFHALRDRYRLGEGDAANEESLREADSEFAELLRKNFFLLADVSHRLVRQGNDTFLFVDVSSGPRYRFEFQRARIFDASELRAALDLDRTTEPSAAALAERLVQYYRNRGYLDATVKAREERLEEGSVNRILFEIREGQLARVVRRVHPCLPPAAPPGLDAEKSGAANLGAEELGDELDASLREELPSRSFLAAIDETVADQAFAPGEASRAPTARREPVQVYEPSAYQHALDHVAELLKSRGYLNALVGPISVVRARCKTGNGGRCIPETLPPFPAATCAVDAFEQPLPEPRLPDGFSCIPDPLHGVVCSTELALSIPIQLGPQTNLFDIVFDGNTHRTSRDLWRLSGLKLGEALSQVEVDAARSRIQNAYADDGYFYATVGVELDYSPDRTRARAHFSIVEHQPVTITGYDLRGATRTDSELILGRLTLCRDLAKCRPAERYFRRGAVRESEESIGSLGVFSSVSISLEDADIPQEKKRVIISVIEQSAQYLEPRAGFSTGEGFRFAFEYGHHNVGNKAVGLTVRFELGYLPDFLILDPGVRANYRRSLGEVGQRLERRNAVSLRFPDVGLGPRVTLNVDGVDVRDNQRDFTLTREALLPLMSYRPTRSLTLQAGASVEVNEIAVYSAGGIEAVILNNPGLATLLRVPEGRTIAISQRLSGTWDRRDSPFAATRGTLLSASIEHVSALPIGTTTNVDSEFLRITARGAGYVRLNKQGMALAFSLAGGGNVQLTPTSATYPDRLFFVGGVGTLRGFGLDSLVPEDLAQQVLAGTLAIETVGVRAGNLFVNPRAEVRLPVTDMFALGLFLDAGNAWSKAASLHSATDLLTLRYATGAGLRATTPVGPIALDGGVNLAPRPWESLGALHFSIGLF